MQLNNLKRFTLITPAEVLFHAPTKQTVDTRLIESSIIISEERFIRDLIGDEFYTALCAEKNRVVTADNLADLQAGVTGYNLTAGEILNSPSFLTPDNLELWDYILWKLTAECVIHTTYPEGFVQFGAEGTHHNQPSSTAMSNTGVVTPGLPSMKWAVEKKMTERINPLLVAAEAYLIRNRIKYPLYPAPENDCETDKPTPMKGKSTNFVLGIYED